MSRFEQHPTVRRILQTNTGVASTQGKMQVNSKRNYDNTEQWFVLALSIWAIAVFVAGYYGLFTKLSLRWIPPIIVVCIVVPVLLYYRNESLRSYIASLNPKHLTLFHVWRIPAGLAFLFYGSRELLPEQFVHNAAYGDLAVGLLAPIVVMLGGGLGKYLAFHLFGLLDFVVAVGTGLTLTLLQVPLIENIATFPIVFIPMYGVCVTGAFSIMTLDTLLRKRKLIKLTQIDGSGV